jgi:Fe-only nitrogenase accessory protein AnfO
MDKLIAVLENSDGYISSFSEAGIVRVYSKNDNEWKVIKDIIFKLDDMENMNSIKAKIQGIAESLEKCKIFVGSKIRGSSFAIFERLGINSWEIEGKPQDFLDYILEKEEALELERNNVEKEIIPAPVMVGKKGQYSLDLNKALEFDSNLTSKKILLPFFKNSDFAELKIICGHVPMWFEREFDNLNLNAVTTKNIKGEVVVTVSPKTPCH